MRSRAAGESGAADYSCRCPVNGFPSRPGLQSWQSRRLGPLEVIGGWNRRQTAGQPAAWPTVRCCSVGGLTVESRRWRPGRRMQASSLCLVCPMQRHKGRGAGGCSGREAPDTSLHALFQRSIRPLEYRPDQCFGHRRKYLTIAGRWQPCFVQHADSQMQAYSGPRRARARVEPLSDVVGAIAIALVLGAAGL